MSQKVLFCLGHTELDAEAGTLADIHEAVPDHKVLGILQNIVPPEGLAGSVLAGDEILRQRGRRAIMWNDGAYGGGIDPSVVLQVWFPDRDGALDAHIAQGGQVYLSPVVPCYCDYPYGEHPVKAVYQLDLTPDYVNSDTVLGGECLTWSEFIRSPERLQELAFPRFTALAEALWCGDERCDYEDFKTRLENIFPVFGQMGIHATPADLWDPEPEEAKRQSRAFRLQFEAESENQDYDALVAAM